MNALVSTAVLCLIVSAVHVSAYSSVLGYIKAPGFPKYMGCYLDDRSRMISASRVDRNDMTHGLCLMLCSKGGHKYAALQAYDCCFCGDSINIFRYPKKPESDCNLPCWGNKNEMCGGSWRNSLYMLF